MLSWSSLQPLITFAGLGRRTYPLKLLCTYTLRELVHIYTGVLLRLLVRSSNRVSRHDDRAGECFLRPELRGFAACECARLVKAAGEAWTVRRKALVHGVLVWLCCTKA